jgi:stearoyl-CoA desaturase (Delta-9 desaturase)
VDITGFVILSIWFSCFETGFSFLCQKNKLHAWVRDHRVHHKFSETPADPHNANRGLFFSHVGWLMKKKHPSCLAKGQKIDMSDVESDPVVTFFDRLFTPYLSF